MLFLFQQKICPAYMQLSTISFSYTPLWGMFSLHKNAGYQPVIYLRQTTHDILELNEQIGLELVHGCDTWQMIPPSTSLSYGHNVCITLQDN